MPSIDMYPDLDYNMLNQNFNQMDQQFNDLMSFESLSVRIDDPLSNDRDEDIGIQDPMLDDDKANVVEHIHNDKIKAIVQEYEERPMLLNGETTARLIKQCQDLSFKEKRAVRQILLSTI